MRVLVNKMPSKKEECLFYKERMDIYNGLYMEIYRDCCSLNNKKCNFMKQNPCNFMKPKT